MPITGLYAAILALIASYLAFRAGTTRGRMGISILHGDSMDLALLIRRHANFTEHVPLALILLCVIELGGLSDVWLHGLGAALVLFRIAHPIGLKLDNIGHPLRAIGAGGTLLVTLIATVIAIVQFFTY